jgi:hypothetical protein
LLLLVVRPPPALPNTFWGAAVSVTYLGHTVDKLCAEHKIEAVMHGVEVALHQLNEQKKQLDALDYKLRSLSQQLGR